MGNQLWIRRFGTGETDFAHALAPDGAGGLIVAGSTFSSLGGPSAGDWDAFLARYHSAGNQLWIRQFGTSERDEIWGMALDNVGSVMVAGITAGSLGGPNAGFEDAFLARYTTGVCYADCDQSTGAGVLDVFDLLCFQNAFVAGCP